MCLLIRQGQTFDIEGMAISSDTRCLAHMTRWFGRRRWKSLLYFVAPYEGPRSSTSSALLSAYTTSAPETPCRLSLDITVII